MQRLRLRLRRLLRHARERDFSQRSVRGGVHQILPFGGVGVNPFAANEMWDADVRNCCGAHWKYLNDVKGWWKKGLFISSRVYRNSEKTTNRDSGELELKIIVQQRINGKISAKFVQSLFAKSQLGNGGTQALARA